MNVWLFTYVKRQFYLEFQFFQGRQFYPRCHPSLPDADLLDHPSLYSIILNLASALEVSHLYYDTHDLQ